ncbi:MAG: HAMP domain-containing histidine kinase [Lachnospiraceae bacterium]|nr:HAMP domain-containing histidine kinase [Candidatus Minthocola equi]
MKKSLLFKFLIGYILFAILSFTLIATFSYQLTYNNLLSSEVSRLRSTVNEIAAYHDDFFSDSEQDEGVTDLHLQSVYSGMRIMLLDEDNVVLYDSSDELNGHKIEAFNSADTAAPYRVGDFYGTFSDDHLTVFSPVVSGYKTTGYVFAHMPVANIASAADSQLLTYYLTFGLILAFSLIILLIFIIFVLRPLRRITFAADQYAGGNLKYELKIDTTDEMGYLGNTLNYMAHELGKTEDYQRQFISNVSHDFRSPLTSIKGYIEAIKDGTIPPENQEKYLNIISDETDRLTGLTQNLMQLNSVSASSFDIKKENFDINDVIRGTCASFEMQCRDKNISFELSLDDHTSLVNADRSKIQQVVYNIVDNAIKFSPKDSSICIEVFRRSEKVFVSIKDSGCGIPKENLKKIWTRFYKTDSSRGKDKKGTGLGLAIVKEIINAHGEFIDVISTEGVGTEFIFSLSAADSDI